MKTLWSYLINPILNATKGNYSKAMRLSTYHDSALFAGKSSPFILALYNFYHPIHEAFMEAYAAWNKQIGTKKGETLNLKQQLILLRKTKIMEWDIAIQQFYRRHTPRYKSLLPKFRKPFQSGKQLDRIDAVAALSISIGNDAALADVKADVDLFAALLSEAYSTQKGSKSTKGTLSGELELARRVMCHAQYANLGGFIQEFSQHPKSIEAFFDLPAIRRHDQIFFTGHLKPKKAKVICKHTFGVDDKIKIVNHGTTDLIFYLAQLRANKPAELYFVAPALSQTTIFAYDLGDLTAKFIKVYNPHETEKGEYSFELL